MHGSLLNTNGVRKYLTANERLAFARAARRENGQVHTFCLMLAFTGARVSELLALTPERIDSGNGVVVFECLKRRQRGVFRSIPIPPSLIKKLDEVHQLTSTGRNPKERLWRWGRTTTWKRVKMVMRNASIDEALAMPKAPRHAFGVDAVQNSVALNIVQRWLEHARIATAAIYTNAVGKEERALAQRTWRSIK